MIPSGSVIIMATRLKQLNNGKKETVYFDYSKERTKVISM